MRRDFDAYEAALDREVAAMVALEKAKDEVIQAKINLLNQWLFRRCYKVTEKGTVDFLPVVCGRKVWSVTYGYAIKEAGMMPTRLPEEEDIQRYFQIKKDRCFDVSQELDD